MLTVLHSGKSFTDDFSVPKPIHKCAGCNKASLTLYCDKCAPPYRSEGDTAHLDVSNGKSAKRLNGKPINGVNAFTRARLEPDRVYHGAYRDDT